MTSIALVVLLAPSAGASELTPADVSTTTESPTGTFPGFNLWEYESGFRVVGITDRYTVRLVPTAAGNVESLRSYAQLSASRVSAATGASITVAAGPGTSTDPAPGEILVRVTGDPTECGFYEDGTPAGACASRDDLGGTSSLHQYIRSSEVIFYVSTLNDSATELQATMDHEFGHALGLGHYNPSYNGEYQLMNGKVLQLVSFRSGDLNGLRYVADHGFKANPFGAFESLTWVTGGFIARGWAIDPDVTGPVHVRLTFGDRKVLFTADEPRSDIGTKYPSKGERHGFSVFVQAPPGAHTVCMHALNRDFGTGDSSLGCRSQTVPGSVYFADANDPGTSPLVQRDDAYVVNGDGITVRLSDGTRFGSNRLALDYGYYGEHLTEFADVTGDGFADAIVVNDQQIVVRPGDAFSQLGPASVWKSSAFVGDQGTYFVDVNNDLRADAVQVDSSTVYVALSTGTGFGPTTMWLSRSQLGARGVFFADADGDRRADAILVDDDVTRVALSDGTSFTTPARWTDRGFFGTKTTAFADVDGDLRADAIAVNADAVYVRSSTGASFTQHAQWTDTAYYGSRGSYFVDVTGDQRADAVVVNDGGVTVRRSAPPSGFSGNEAWTALRAYYGTK